MYSKLSLFVALALVSTITPIHSAATTEVNKFLTTSPDAHMPSSQLYTFGGVTGITVLDSASRLNSTTGEWEAVHSMLNPASYFCGAVVDKQIYLFGGYEDYANASSRLATANVYNSLTDTYIILRAMPEDRAGCGAAALDGSIYVTGGTVGSGYNPSSSLIRYDIRNNQWSTLSPTKFQRNTHQMIELNRLLYAIGGANPHASKTVEVYNTTTDRWSMVASTHNNHYDFGVAVNEGKIYVLSRYGFEVYSPGTNQWTNLNPPIAHFHSGSTLVTMNGQLWATGGSDFKDGKATFDKQVYTYEPSTDRWTQQRDMDVPRTYHTAFVVNL